LATLHTGLVRSHGRAIHTADRPILIRLIRPTHEPSTLELLLAILPRRLDGRHPELCELLLPRPAVPEGARDPNVLRLEELVYERMRENSIGSHREATCTWRTWEWGIWVKWGGVGDFGSCEANS